MKLKKLIAAVLTIAMLASMFSVISVPVNALSVGTKTQPAVTFVTGDNGSGTAITAAPTGDYTTIATPGAKEYAPAWLEYTFTTAEGTNGKYNVAWNFRWHETGRMWQITVDGTVVGQIDTSYKYSSAASYVTCNATDTGLSTGTPGEVELVPGNHTIRFDCIGIGANSTNAGERFTLKNIELTCTEVISSYETPVYAISGVPSSANAAFTLPTSVTDTANNVPCGITWASSNENVISIDGGNATVNTVASGLDSPVLLTATVNTVQGNETKAFAVLVENDITTISQYNLLALYEGGFTTHDKCDVVSQSKSGSGVATTHNFVRLDNTESVGATITFPVNVKTEGTYKFYYVYRNHNSCGKVQTFVNGTAVGDPVDQGNSAAGYNNNIASPEIEVQLNAGMNTITYTVVERSGDNNTSNGGKANIYDMYFTYVDEENANVIQSVEALADINAAVMVEKDDISLPDNVTVTLGSTDTVSLPVIWSDYNKYSVTEQTLTGTIVTDGTDYTNEANITASINIVSHDVADAGNTVFEMRYHKRTQIFDGETTVYKVGQSTGIGSGTGSDEGHYYWYGKSYGKISAYVEAGTYLASYNYKTRAAAGTVQLAIGGADIGDAVDQMNATQVQKNTGYLGLVTVAESGYIDFEITSTAEFTCDAVTLTPAADYTAVTEAIATVPQDLTLYTDTSVAALQSALDAVDYLKPASEQTSVDAYADAIDSAVKGLIEKTVEMQISISEGMVVAADTAGKYNITWNAAISAGDGTSVTDINSAGVVFKEYGVYYAASNETLADYKNASADEIRQRIIDNGEDITVYTMFGFRLKNVNENATRAAMFYVEYELNGSRYIVLSSIDEQIVVVV